MVKPKHLRNIPTKSARGVSTKPVRPSPKKPVVDQILEWVLVDEDPYIRDCYEEILGIAGHPLDLVLSNLVLMPKILVAGRRALHRHLVDNGFHWGVQVTRCGVVAGSKVDVDVPAIRKFSSYYSRAGVDAIAMIVPCPVPLASDPCGFGIALDHHSLFFGPHVRAEIQKAELKAHTRSKNAPDRGPIQWHEPDDEDGLKATMASMFRPPLTKVPNFEGIEEGPTVGGWNAREARHLRGFLTLVTRSMLPMKKALILIGEGRSVMAGPIAAAEVSIKKGRREGQPLVHPDGLPHFWFRELVRLGRDDLAVPLIKLR